MRKTAWLIVLIAALAVMMVAEPALAKKDFSTGARRAVDRGSVIFGGDVDFSLATGSYEFDPDKGNKDKTDVFTFGMDTLAGYFVIKGLEVGGLLIVERESNDSDTAKVIETTWAFAPQAGYFFAFNSALSAFGIFPLGYYSATTETEPAAKNAKDISFKHSGLFVEPRAGIVWHINQHLGLAPSLYLRYDNGSGTNDNGFSDMDFDATRTMFGLKVGLFGFI
jgi:hypothetical protein